MLKVLAGTWALFLGLALLMVGNGLQGSLLGVRGGIEGFSTYAISIVMSGYFAGFLVSSSVTPRMIQRVGHVRVFAALGSLISAALILFPVATDPVAWTVLRAVLGFCFCGVYITTESWLNDATTTQTRGTALSLYMLVQMGGIVFAQWLLSLGDPAGFVLFIVPSVLVSVAFAPILLTASPAPRFERTRAMSLPRLFRSSPLGVVGMFLLGGVYAAQFGMSAVFAAQAGLRLGQLSTFIAAFYVGAVLSQMPIGWISDRVDRRVLVLVMAALGAGVALVGMWAALSFEALVATAFLIGALTNPLYPLLLAYVNDAIDREDMAAASGGLLFVNGVGAILGPPALAGLMTWLGPRGFWLFDALVLSALALYAAWRMTRRRATPVAETARYAPLFVGASPVAVQVAGAWAEAEQEAAVAPEGNQAADGTLEPREDAAERG